jgi:predicted phosphohydrolase
MDFQVVSDLHLDTRGGFDAPDHAFPQRKAPILVLAGDLASAMDPDYEDMLAKVAEPFDMVLYVPGNHEYYGSEVSVERMDERIEEICYSVGNVVYLNKRRVDIKGISYIGATLWTNCPNDSSPMNDFSHINNGDFTPAQENRIHREHRDWLKGAIKQSKRDRCAGAVVITHHAPDTRLQRGTVSRPPEIFPYYFASDMRDLTTDSYVQVWVHGHTHESYRWQMQPHGTIFASNALGYERENTGFSDDAILRI